MQRPEDSGITVVIPCYNHQAYVTECLASIDTQDVDDLEVIVIDDGSKDDTWRLIEAHRFKDNRRVQRIRQQNAGAHAAINRGLQLASGRYVTVCNSDDAFAPGRLRHLTEVLESAHARFAFSGVSFVDEAGRDISESWDYARDIQAKQREIELFPSVGFAIVLSNVGVSTGNFFFERSLLAEIGFFRPYRYCHDWDFLLRVLLLTEPLYVPAPLYRYRLHAANSFLALAEAAGQECPELMRRFLKAAAAGPQNRLCPSPKNWPVYFDHFIRQHRYEPYMVAWDQVDGPRYNPFAPSEPVLQSAGAQP